MRWGLLFYFSGETFPERPMYTGKTLFAQLMDFLPWTTFARIVERYGWRPLRQVVALRRTLPGYGVCPTDLSGESQRHRSVPVGPSLEALSHGFPRTDSALDAVRRERSPRLAHLRRLRPGADPSGQKALCCGELRDGTHRNGLCTRFDNNRSVLIGFPV